MWDQGLHSRSSHMVSERTWTDFAASYGKHSNLHTGIVQNLNAQIGMDCLQLLASSAQHGQGSWMFLIIYDNTTCFICKCTSESRWEQPSNRPALVNIKDRHAAWILSEVVFLVQGIREEGIKPNAKGAAAILSYQISLPDGTCMILAVSAWQLTACWRTQAALNDLNHLEQGISVFAAVCIPCLKREAAWHFEMLSLTSWLWKPGSSFETQHCPILSHGARSTSSEDWMAATFWGPFKVHSRFVRAISLGSSPWFQLLRRQA